ncbi:MAG: proline dehydrogenase family protein [Euryarchaeota archaeon]|nr:proline dehydrogenase family protein [Euryarchaeota archaeon]
MASHDTRWTLPDLPSAVHWCATRNEQGIRCIVDVLGEYARKADQATDSVDAYMSAARTIDEHGLNASLTVKLSALGALFDQQQCRANVRAIAEETARRNIGFEIDMEVPNLIEYTIDVTRACARQGRTVTVALQAYMDRTRDDLVRICTEGGTARVVKGAYMGTIRDFGAIQQRFKALIDLLYAEKVFFAVGTHDPELLAWMMTRMEARKDMVEFGFLKGLADQTKTAMVNDGWRVSEYVPFGEHAAGYETRRRQYLRSLEVLHRAPVP